jgi:site-specific DNA-methyltransferase (adenine-specific)
MAESTKHITIQGDCRQMSEFADKSVHLIVTSPPYWQLKGIRRNFWEYK